MQRRTFLKSLGILAATGLTTYGCGGEGVAGTPIPPIAPAPTTPTTSQLSQNRLIFSPDFRTLELAPIQNRVLLRASNGSVVFDQATLGTAAGQWSFPSDAAFGSDGLLYVVDSGNGRVQVLDASGAVVRSLPLGFPTGIAESGGRAYVSDGPGHRIMVFDATGALINQFGTLGTENGQFNYPVGLAFDRDGNLHVCDAGNGRVQVFTADGAFVRGYGSGTSLNFPQKIAIDPEGNCYVGDINDQEIQAFDAAGASLPPFPLPSASAPLEPAFVSLSPDLVLWVTDSEA